MRLMLKNNRFIVPWSWMVCAGHWLYPEQIAIISDNDLLYGVGLGAMALSVRRTPSGVETGLKKSCNYPRIMSRTNGLEFSCFVGLSSESYER